MIKIKETELQMIHSDSMVLAVRIRAECENTPQYHLIRDSLNKLISELHTLVLDEIKGENKQQEDEKRN